MALSSGGAHALLRNSQRNAPFGFGDGGNLTLSANALLDWDGKRWTLLNLGKTTTTLLPEEGTLIQLETPVFLHLIDTHVIQVKDTSQSPTMALSAEVHRLLIEAGDEALEVANQRYLLVEAYQNKQQEIYAGTPTRTIRDWLTNFRDAEAAYGYGYGYVGLLPKTAARGNREPKVTEERRRLLDEAIAQWYARPKQQKVRDVFVLYQRTCLEQHIQPVCERTFYRHVKQASGPALTEKRKGAKAAYQESTWYWELEHTTPRHGDRPWEIAHIDHTQLDIELLSSLGKPLGRPWATLQDIEWCLVDDTFSIVQSRPITTLYPIPEANDEENHVYVSVGHQQMMTDPMKPLGISFFLLTTNAPMCKAGGRLFVDITHNLASPVSRKTIIDALGQSDPLIKDALMTIVEREDFIKSSPDGKKVPSHRNGNKGMPWSYLAHFENNPTLIPDLMKSSQTSIEELKQTIQTKSGADLFDFILEDIPQLKKILFNPQSLDVTMVAIYASSWINRKMMKWLGEKNVADTLSLSVPNNITSEMGLELLDVADVIRPYPEVIDYLQHVKDDNFLDELVKFDGGQKTQVAIYAYLNKYGMRCTGEIDITKTRWSEKPTTLVPMILSNIKNFEPHASKRKFEQGRQEALKKEQEVLDRLKQLPDGERKAKETKRMISLIRNFIGYREYPKYGMINRYFVYKQALLKEAEQLVQANAIYEKEDIYYLTFEELREVVRTHTLDYQIISKRKDEYKFYEKLTPHVLSRLMVKSLRVSTNEK